jgi:hypothetical protein
LYKSRTDFCRPLLRAIVESRSGKRGGKRRGGGKEKKEGKEGRGK